MLFDSDASFNYILSFITKSKNKRLRIKKKEGGREREERQQSPAAGWEMTFQFVNWSSPPPSLLSPPGFFSFLFLLCKLISPFIMWKDCKRGSPDTGWARTTCISFGYGHQRCGHKASTVRWKKCPHVFNSQVSGCPGEITGTLSTDSPKHLCTWKVGSYRSSSAQISVQVWEPRTKKAFSQMKSWIPFFCIFFPLHMLYY